MKLLAGNSNPELCAGISGFLGVPLLSRELRRFSDCEIHCEIGENVRGEDVFVIQSTAFPANDNLMELLVCIDALKRASARRITAVIPYFGYARQDRKPAPRTPISAKLVANLLTVAGTSRVLTVDLHAGQLQGFFDIPVDNLYASPLITRDIRSRHDTGRLTVVSPDVGGVIRARAVANALGTELAIVDKRREKPGVSAVMHVIGDVAGRHCVLVDDLADSAGTLCNAADALLERGATGVSAWASHGVLSGGAMERLRASALREVMVTDSIHHDVILPPLRRLSIAPLIGDAIRRISEERSVSCLFRVDYTDDLPLILLDREETLEGNSR